MLDIEQLTKLAQDWFKTVPEHMKDKVIVASYNIKPMSFTPREIVSKVQAAARKTKTRAEFLKESGLCAEFLETLERMYERRMKREQKGRAKS
jgi:hypothetical protein